jgi:hypothetical protein
MDSCRGGPKSAVNLPPVLPGAHRHPQMDRKLFRTVENDQSGDRDQATVALRQPRDAPTLG